VAVAVSAVRDVAGGDRADLDRTRPRIDVGDDGALASSTDGVVLNAIAPEMRLDGTGRRLSVTSPTVAGDVRYRSPPHLADDAGGVEDRARADGDQDDHRHSLVFMDVPHCGHPRAIHDLRMRPLRARYLRGHEVSGAGFPTSTGT
jgi:hypothetical protein